MGKRQMEFEALIMERNREIDALAKRIAELEDTVRGYKEREESISEAITSAISTKTKMIKDASARARRTIEDANAKAEQVRGEIKLVIGRTKEEAANLLEKARAEASAIVDRANAEAKRVLGDANAQSAQTKKNCLDVNKELIEVSEKLNEFVVAARASFEKAYITDGKNAENKSVEAGQAPLQENQEGPELPDSYENPAELFRGIMAIQGRRTPGEEAASVTEADAAPHNTESNIEEIAGTEFIPLKGSLLSGDDIKLGVERISVLGDKNENNESFDPVVNEILID